MTFRRSDLVRKHAINFPGEEIALSLGLARPPGLFEEALAGNKSLVSFVRKIFVAEWQRAVSAGETEPWFRKEARRTPCPRGLREGFLNEVGAPHQKRG